jgi:uncharacterized protein
MMTREEVLATLRKHLPELQKKYPIASLELFGSYARNEQTPESDMDFLVEFKEPVGIEFVDLLIELESILGVEVDLVSKRTLRPSLKPYVEPDLVTV